LLMVAARSADSLKRIQEELVHVTVAILRYLGK